MADKVYLSWNLPNWITVVLMVTFGAIVVGLAASAVGAMRDPA